MRVLAPTSLAVLLLVVSVFPGCAHRGPKATTTSDGASLKPVVLGTLPDGREVQGFVLDSGRGLTATFSSLGAGLVRARFPDREGTVQDILLGHDRFSDRLAAGSPAGVVVGRTADEIPAGMFEIDRIPHHLSRDARGRHRDGGTRGFGRRLWAADTFEGDEGVGVRFHLVSEAGDQGYPGRVEASVTWTVTPNNEILLETVATTDATTPVDLAPNLWFALGGPEGDARHHQLRLWTDGLHTVTDKGPQLEDVTGGAFDFVAARPIGMRLDHTGGRWDHVLATRERAGALRPVADLVDPESGRMVSMWTSRPAFRLEGAQRLAGHMGFGGSRIHSWTGVLIRPQAFPNAVGTPGLPSILLEPGKKDRTFTRLVFGHVEG